MKTVFIASSRKWYAEVKHIKWRLDSFGVKGYYPYFKYHDETAELDPKIKKQLTHRFANYRCF